jgi:hypothetical protein
MQFKWVATRVLPEVLTMATMNSTNFGAVILCRLEKA